MFVHIFYVLGIYLTYNAPAEYRSEFNLII